MRFSKHSRPRYFVDYMIKGVDFEPVIFETDDLNIAMERYQLFETFAGIRYVRLWDEQQRQYIKVYRP